MVPTLAILNSDGEVVAPVGKRTMFLRGKRQRIKITGIGPNPYVPLTVRKALVGLTVDTIFTKEQIKVGDLLNIPDGSRIAYASEVIEELEKCGKTDAANDLRIVANGELDMYVFVPSTFELA